MRRRKTTFVDEVTLINNKAVKVNRGASSSNHLDLSDISNTATKKQQSIRFASSANMSRVDTLDVDKNGESNEQ